MSEYTPTTGHILEAFAWDERYDGLDTEKMKQFDRWLAEVKAKAWEECSEAYIQTITSGSANGGFWRIDNPYRQEQKIILSNNDYDQLRKALDEE